MEHEGVSCKRSYSRFTEYQLSELEKRFKIDPYIKGMEKVLMAENLGSTQTAVAEWFRSKRKRKRRLANEASNATVVIAWQEQLITSSMHCNLWNRLLRSSYFIPCLYLYTRTYFLCEIVNIVIQQHDNLIILFILFLFETYILKTVWTLCYVHVYMLHWGCGHSTPVCCNRTYPQNFFFKFFVNFTYSVIYLTNLEF